MRLVPPCCCIGAFSMRREPTCRRQSTFCMRKVPTCRCIVTFCCGKIPHLCPRFPSHRNRPCKYGICLWGIGAQIRSPPGWSSGPGIALVALISLRSSGAGGTLLSLGANGSSLTGSPAWPCRSWRTLLSLGTGGALQAPWACGAGRAGLLVLHAPLQLVHALGGDHVAVFPIRWCIRHIKLPSAQ